MGTESVPLEHHGPARLPLRIAGVEHYFDLHLFVDAGRRWATASLGPIDDGEPVPTRIESACLFGHVFQSSQCDCRDQLHQAFERIAVEGRGLVVYGVDDDARGMGMAAHFDIYKMRQIDGLDTDEVLQALDAPLDARDHAAPARILRALGVHRVGLLSNNPERVRVLQDAGIEVERTAHEAPVTRFNMTTLHLEKEDLQYGWEFTTHTRFVDAIAAEPGSGWLARRGEVEIARAGADDVWDLAWDVPASTDDEIGVLYATDVPPLDVLPALRASGIQVIVVATHTIDHASARAAEAFAMRITDWARSGVAHPREPQWQPLAIAPGVGAVYEHHAGGRWTFRGFDGRVVRTADLDASTMVEQVRVPVPSALRDARWHLMHPQAAPRLDLRSAIEGDHG